MRRVILPIGTRIGNLVVMRNDLRLDGGDGKLRWANLLQCDCGKTCVMKNGAVHKKTGYCSNDCGLRWASNDKGIGLGLGQPGWYKSYNAMKARCYTVKPPSATYNNYRGRGIAVCARWLDDPMAFYEDMGDRPDDHTLDRIDADGDYEPRNCRWATAETQARNKRAKPASNITNLASNRTGVQP